MFNILTIFLIFAFLNGQWKVDANLKRKFNPSKRELSIKGPIVQPGYSSDIQTQELEEKKIIVSKEALAETDRIRDNIQEAVDEDVYVVQLDDKDFNMSKEKTDIKHKIIKEQVIDVTEVIEDTKTIKTKKIHQEQQKWLQKFFQINQKNLVKFVNDIKLIFDKLLTY